ncbi:MAG: alcohol dehydrogenase catalytic domain-containing protein [Candidatus Thermoplasmatota archaeon]|nr:alcohol dehydrogenase catalytic domain-containing protein [Candidatus Thermoplasmatota archaeon]
MRTVLLEGRGKVFIRDVSTPSPEPGDLLVEMRACGLCGSDLEKIQGVYTAAPPILGHEAVGVIAEVGQGAEGFEVGDRVFPHHHVPCYECVYCRRGSQTMCPEYRRWHLDPGGFSECFRVPRWNVSHGGVLILPETMSFQEGSFIEPLACCIRALDRLGVPEGSDVLIVGAGPMGLLLLQLLGHWGAGQVMVSEVSPYRLEAATRLGAQAAVNPLEVDVTQEVRRLTDRRGADLAIVASGSPKALSQAIHSVRRGGKVGLVGIPDEGSSLSGVSDLVTREISLISSNAATEMETRRALELISEGVVDVQSMVTHRVHLKEFPKAIELARKAESIKVVVVP